MKILVTDGMDKTALEQLKQNGHEVTEQFYPPEELGAALKEYDESLLQLCGRAGDGSHVLLRPVPLRGWRYHAGRQVGEESLWQGN